MISALDALLAELQPALAQAQSRMFQPDVLPDWQPAAAEHVEILTPDGAVLLTGAEGALPYEPGDGSAPLLGFWLRQGSGVARRAMAAAGSGQPVQFQVLSTARPGAPCWWDVTVTPLRASHGAVESLLVVSREASIVLDTVRAVQMVAEAMPAMIAVIDRALTVRYVNRASLDWLGLPPDAVTGRRVPDVVGAEGFAQRRPHLEAALAGQDAALKMDWPRRDGGHRAADVRYLAQRDAEGKPDGCIAVVSEVAVQDGGNDR